MVDTEKTIDKVEKIMGFKKGVKEIKSTFDADGLDENDSISKDTTSSTRGSII